MRGEIIFVLTMFLVSNAFALCNLNISMMNQEPYPAVPGDIVKIVFQADAAGSNDCGGIVLELIEKYPFTIDPSSKKSYTFPSNIYARDYSNVLMAPFTIRVDKEALDSESPIEIKYGNIIKTFYINVDDVRSKFEVFVADYDIVSKQIVFEIQNIGKSDSNAVTIEIPSQDGVDIYGANKQNIGSLSSNDDTRSDFKIYTQNNIIKMNIYYSDSTNTRRVYEENIDFNIDNFYHPDENKFSFSSLIIPLILVSITVIFFVRRRSKYKKI